MAGIELHHGIMPLTGLNQWQSTQQVINWFKNIENKSRKQLLQLDIKDFYPSISEQLLLKAFEFAQSNGAPFSTQEKEIIMPIYFHWQ